MGSCSASNQKSSDNLDMQSKNYKSMQNENTQINSEPNTNRPSLQQPQQPRQAQGDQLLNTQQFPQQNIQQIYQIDIIQQQNDKNNLFNNKIQLQLQIAEEFNLTLLKGQLIYMIHRECEQFRNFLCVKNNDFEEFINMFLQQRLEYFNYNQEEINIISQLNQQLPVQDQIRTRNKFIGRRKIQQIRDKIRDYNNLMKLKQLEHIPQEEIEIKVQILKAIDIQINQLNEANLKKLLFIKEFYVCLLREEKFTLNLEEVEIEKLMLSF